MLKKGKTEFIVFCDRCGCKFAYEINDIYKNKITCPDCRHAVEHSLRLNSKKKKIIRENKRKIIIFFVKLFIYIVLGITIWNVTAAKYKNTEKDVDENIVAEEITEGVETAVELG